MNNKLLKQIKKHGLNVSFFSRLLNVPKRTLQWRFDTDFRSGNEDVIINAFMADFIKLKNKYERTS